MVAVGVEIRIGDSTGMMNMAMPAIIIKMMRQKFEQQWSVRKAESTDAEQSRMLRFVKEASVELDSRLVGSSFSVDDLLNLEPGDILSFDHPLNRPLDFAVNGKLKFKGRVVASGNKRAFVVEDAD